MKYAEGKGLALWAGRVYMAITLTFSTNALV
jgi:hypothetical protein